MKNYQHQHIVKQMVHELTGWLAQLRTINEQLDDHYPLSHDDTVQLSCIVNQLEHVDDYLKNACLNNSKVLIDCFSNCVSQLKTVCDKLYDHPSSMVLQVLVDNAHHDYKLTQITNEDLYLN